MITELKNRLLLLDGEPTDVQFHVKLNKVLLKNVLSLDVGKSLSVGAQQVEVFSGKHPGDINVVINKIIAKFCATKILNITGMHINHKADQNDPTIVHIETIKSVLESKSMYLIVQYLKDFTRYGPDHDETTTNTVARISTNDDDDSEVVRKPFEMQLISNYEASGESDPILPRKLAKISIDNVGMKLKQKKKWGDDNFVALQISDFVIHVMEDNRISAKVYQIECIDGIKSSLWYKAMYTQNVEVYWLNGYLSIKFGRDINLNIDQNFLMFIDSYFDLESLETPGDLIDNPSIMGMPETETREPNKTPFQSIHISKTVFRLDFKPKQSNDFFEFVNFIPLRNAKVVFDEFYLFGIKSTNHLIQKVMMNFIANIGNVQGLIAGIKPLKPVAKILSNAQNVVVVPMNTKLDENFMKEFKSKMKKMVKNTTVEVLEVGSGFNVSLKGRPSIYADQPGSIQEGLSQAHIEFTEGIQTVVAFVKDTENFDLLSLPVAVVKPFTGSLSKIFLGICNQIDPERKKRMDAKYKSDNNKK